jgi:hypothetical protein
VLLVRFVKKKNIAFLIENHGKSVENIIKTTTQSKNFNHYKFFLLNLKNKKHKGKWGLLFCDAWKFIL